MKKKSKEKILVAMSGGVDSSVVALLLSRANYDITGAFMVNYDDGTNCWRQDYQDAIRVAAKLGISIIRLDFIKEYKKFVLDYMFSEYESGRTPNPDVLCNKFIKFGVWLTKAKELGFDKLATGHYAQIIQLKDHSVNGSFFCLKQGKDKEKDQTYFLHQLNQEQLSHTLFPIGEYNKQEVRNLARKYELPTAEKEESMGICFVGEVPMKDFLMKKIEQKPGRIITSAGEVVGEHVGLAFYTIGQRHDIGVSNQPPTGRERHLIVKHGNTRSMYVVDKRFDSNELVVGYEDDPCLFKQEIIVTEVNWIAGQPSVFPLKCKVRLRHRQSLQNAQIEEVNSKIVIKFDKPQRAVTPGQFAVFYMEDECLGGGIIL